MSDGSNDLNLVADADANGVGDIVFKTGTTERARIKADGTGTGLFGGLQPFVGRRVMAIGDSITANGYSGMNVPIGKFGQISGGQGYLAWASLISNGRLAFGGVAATGGYTASDILVNHVPTAIAAKPSLCVVLAGANDVTTATPIASYIATMTSIFTQLAGAGIIPVVCTLPPNNSLSGVETNLTPVNLWLSRYAREHGLPLVDFFGAMAADDGTYQAGFNADTIHPSTAGAKVMGQALWTALSPWLPPGNVFIHQDQPTTDTTRLITNNLFLTDTNADGVPDQWTGQAGPTYSLATDTANFGARSGKVWTIAGSGGSGSSTQAVAPSTGDKLWFAIKFSTSGVQAAGGTIDIRLINNAFTTDLLSLVTFPVQDTAGSAVYTLAGEVTYPAGIGNIKVSAQVRTGGTLKLAQPTLLNLTALGLA